MFKIDDTLLKILLNKVRVGNINQSCEDILKSLFIQREDPKYPLQALCNIGENASAQMHINTKLFDFRYKSYDYRKY